jgi:hypothetical protein
MSLNREIVKDTRAARRFRLLAPLAALLALAALTLAPGIIAELRNDRTTVGAIPPGAWTRLAAGRLSTATVRRGRATLSRHPASGLTNVGHALV